MVLVNFEPKLGSSQASDEFAKAQKIAAMIIVFLMTAQRVCWPRLLRC